MAEMQLAPELVKELQQDLAADDIQRGLQRLTQTHMLEGAVLMSSEAKAQWSAIGARADKGQGTLVRRRDGVTLLVVPLTKAVELAAASRSERTMGDIRRAYPGVAESEAPDIRVRGGRVWAPQLLEATPAKPTR